MKTIYVAFVESKIPSDQAAAKKQYSFNTSLDVAVGTVLRSQKYAKSRLQVTKIEDTHYTHFGFKGGLFTEEGPGRGEIVNLDDNSTEIEGGV